MWDRVEGRGNIRRATDAPIALVPDRVDDSELLGLINDDRLQTHFQPQFDLASGRLIGAEALARIPGSRSADDLFRRAAAAGLAERVSRQAQRNALRLTADWGDNLAAVSLSLNVLPQDIARPNFPAWLAGEAESTGIAFRRITLEITEDALIADPEAVALRLNWLRDLGMAIALDDFGTGYANLSHLAKLPLDILKIDRTLIAGIVSNRRDRTVGRAIVRLAHDLGLKVVVEGVETADQLALLGEWGCDFYQGFLRSPPMPLDQFRSFAALHLERSGRF